MSDGDFRIERRILKRSKMIKFCQISRNKKVKRSLKTKEMKSLTLTRKKKNRTIIFYQLIIRHISDISFHGVLGFWG